MEKIILILLIICVSFMIFNYEGLNNNTNIKTIMLVAIDENNEFIFKNNDIYYKLNKNEELIQIENNGNKYKYYDYPANVPIDSNTMKLQINLTFNDFKFIGILANKFYDQQYILYEKVYDKDYELEDQLYYYILIKIINGIYTVMYELEPRNKITPNEYIWASEGAFQIGPLNLL
jgi:hypothetical protein